MHYNPSQHERLSELVTQLGGAALQHNLGADSLWNLAEALIAIRAA